MRRRDRLPDWRPDPERDLEKVVIGEIVRGLEAEGGSVTGLWYPDRDRADPRRAGRATTPDAALLVDGREAAIELAHAYPHPRGDASHRAAATARLVDERIRAATPGLPVFVFGTYAVDQLMARPKAGIASEAARLAAAAVEIASAGPCNQVMIPDPVRPTWLLHAHVSRPEPAWPDQRGSVRVVFLAGGSREEHVDDVIRYAMKVKAPRLAEWGLGIVALMEGWGPPADDLAAALAARTDWPVWRFYWLTTGRVRLLWQG